MFFRSQIFACYAMVCAVFAAPLSAETVRQSIWAQIGTPDPIYTTTLSQSNIIAAAFDRLFTYDRDGQIVPDQVKSWTVSEDGKTYRFELRDDIFWTDGQPVIAQDYVLNFRRILNPALNEFPKPTYMLDMVLNAQEIKEGRLPSEKLGVRATGPKTLEIELRAPTSYFVPVLASVAMTAAPSHILRTEDDPLWVERKPFVSNGRYNIQSIDDMSTHMVLRNDHWDKADFEELEFILYTDQSKIFQDILDDRLDLAIGITRKQDAWVTEAFKGKVKDHLLEGTSYGVFNTLAPKFADVRVRRALRLAIDRKALARSIGLAADFAAEHFTPPQLYGGMIPPASDWQLQSLPERQVEARRLLAEAGYDASNPLEVEIMSTAINDSADLAIAIKAMWNAIGVKARVDIAMEKELSRRLVGNEYEFGVAFWYGDYSDPMTFLGLFQSGGSKNHSDWSNKDYDALLKTAMSTTDLAARMALYAQMEALIDAEVPITPLTHLMMKVIRSDLIGDYWVYGSVVIRRFKAR